VATTSKVVNHVPAPQRGLAMVFRSYALYPHMTVYQNMAFGPENIRMDRAEIERRVAKGGADASARELPASQAKKFIRGEPIERATNRSAGAL